MSPDLARKAAAAVLSAVTDDRRTLEDALESVRSYTHLEGRDRSFARAVASAALRRLGAIDKLLAHFMARPLTEGAEVPRAILRTGAAQLLVMNVAPHAAVSAAVDLANAARSARPFAGLINAVLRRCASEGRELFSAYPPGSDLPDWLFTRWAAAYGTETAEAIALGLHEEPPLDLQTKSDPSQWAERLGGRLGPFGGVRLPPGQDVASLAGFADGEWWVQDAAASLPARLLGDVAGLNVLDLCAAPGGKTMQLAAAGAHVAAVDKDEARLARVHANLERTKLSAQVIAQDIADWAPPEPVDAILLDAPCSATGTLRRHPDVAWLRRPTDIPALAELQKALLGRAAAWLKPGGVLVYSVCSLEPEEGEGVVPAALEAGLRPDPIARDELGGVPEAVTGSGHVRTHPALAAAEGGMDGFFIARFRR